MNILRFPRRAVPAAAALGALISSCAIAFGAPGQPVGPPSWESLPQPASDAPSTVSNPGSTSQLRSFINRTETVSGLVTDALKLMRGNRNEQAAAMLKKAVELDPSSAQAHHNYGLALAKLGDTQHAIDQLQRAVNLNPDSEASLLTLAGLQQSVGHMSEAIVLYNNFLERFAQQNRPGVKNTYSKIKELVAGLTQERSEIDQVRRDSKRLQPIDEMSQSVLQVPAQMVADDDYLAEATRKAILRWPVSRMPIKVCIHPGDPVGKPGDPSYFSGVPNYKPQWKDILVLAFRDWEKASTGLVKFEFVQPSTVADLDCYFVCDPTKEYGGLQNDAEAGEAKMFMNEDGLAKGSIKLLTKSLSSVLPLTDNRMRVICLHEIGHALGLAGHTDNPGDIMFYSTSFRDEWRNLSGRDARTIQRLYSAN